MHLKELAQTKKYMLSMMMHEDDCVGNAQLQSNGRSMWQEVLYTS